MKRFLGIILLLVSIVSLSILHIPQISQLKNYPTPILEQEKRDLQIQKDALSLTTSSMKDSRSTQLKIKIACYQVELYRRQYPWEWLAMAFGIFGVALIVLSVIKKRNPEQTVKKTRVVEAMPSEIYVDEREFYQRRQDAFTSKEQALLWFESDPLKVCSYCGSSEVKPVRGHQDEVQLFTFYKKVPEGAKDLRIILGSFWFVKAASELQCENCKQKVVR